MPAVAVKERSRSLRPEELKVLVLNADYRPLSTWPLSLITAQEAISALWRERVTVVETWEGAFFRSPSQTIAVPKVIALVDYADVHSNPKCNRRNIFLRDRFCCQYCGQRFETSQLTYDHVIPRSKGGRTVWSNILTACISCNGEKKDQMPNYSGRKRSPLRPLKTPRQPTNAELLRAGLDTLSSDIVEDFGSALYWGVELEA
jgi:5-methylcytosine-specific restriction endonuclease McrA